MSLRPERQLTGMMRSDATGTFALVRSRIILDGIKYQERARLAGGAVEEVPNDAETDEVLSPFARG